MAVDAGKKRKRDGAAADGGKHKKKKVSIKDGPAKADSSKAKVGKTVRVTNVLKPQFSAPVVATTSGLVIPESIEFDCYTRDHNSSSRSSKKKRSSAAPQEMLLHSSAHRTVDYTAKEDNVEGAESSLRHYVGIFDPATGELQVVEAKKMRVRGTVRARKAAEDEMHGTVISKTMSDMRTNLGETFGTKKAKKALLSVTENAISNRKRNEDGTFDEVQLTESDRALMEIMEATTSTMATREQLQEEVDKAKPIPKGNFEATAVQDVYVPEKIIGADVLTAVPVRDWQEATRAGEDIPLYSRYVASRITQVAAREDGLGQLRLLRYLYWMILFWQQARPGRERDTKRLPPRAKVRENMHDAPEAIIEDLRYRFTDSGTFRKFNMDLLMTHCCAFASVLDGFDVNMSDLLEDLRLEKHQLSQYFSEIGARVRVVKKDDKTMHMAKLSLPLKFPRETRRRRR